MCRVNEIVSIHPRASYESDQGKYLELIVLVLQQGHFQIVLSNEHCPLFQKDLSIFQRLMYCSGVWSYVVGAITAPMFIAIPLITIWAGVFPIVVSWWAAGVCPLHLAALISLLGKDRHTLFCHC